MKHKLIAMTAAFLLAMTPLTASALTEPVVPSACDGAVFFPKSLEAAGFSLIVSSNQECTVTHAENGCTFTPEEDGRYVVSTSEYCEEIIEFGTSEVSGHFHYFYPVLTNYVVYVEDGEITYKEKGTKSWFSQEQIDAEVLAMHDAIAAGEAAVLPCYNVYAANADAVLHGMYFTFVNGQLPSAETRYTSYITNVYSEFGTESYFCANYCSADIQPDMNGNEPQRVTAEEMDISDLLTHYWTSSTCDGNLTTATPDIMELTRIAAPEADGNLTVLVDNLDEVFTYPLTVEDGIFRHRKTSEIMGDANDDGSFSVTDVVMVQKYLLGIGSLTAPDNADFCKDGVVNGFDLAIMKQELVN